MELTRLVIHEGEIQRIAGRNGPLGQMVDGLASQVVNEAIANATSRPGPMIRSGDLVEHVRKQAGADERGYFVDVGSDAEHRGYPYPSRLETGQDGQLFPWLRPALEEVFGRIR